MSYVVKDSGTRRSFDTGAVRDGATGKGRFDLLPYEALFEYALHSEMGAVKYDARNWEKGIALSVFLDSAIRHAYKALAGWTDENHAAAAMWNLGSFIATRARIKAGILPKELDDLPRYEVKYLDQVETEAKIVGVELKYSEPETPKARPELVEAITKFAKNCQVHGWFRQWWIASKLRADGHEFSDDELELAAKEAGVNVEPSLDKHRGSNIWNLR